MKEFIDQENKFDGLIIVGSPNPHGIFKTSARDGHYAIQLAFFLGNVCNLPSGFVVKLDEVSILSLYMIINFYITVSYFFNNSFKLISQ